MLVDRLRHRVDIVWQQTLELSCSYDQFEYLKTYIYFSEILLELLTKQNYLEMISIWISIPLQVWWEHIENICYHENYTIISWTFHGTLYLGGGLLCCFVYILLNNRPSITDHVQIWEPVTHMYINTYAHIYFHTQQCINVWRINVIKTLHEFAATWLWFRVFSLLLLYTN